MTEQILIYAAAWYGVGALSCVAFVALAYFLDGDDVTVEDIQKTVLFSGAGPFFTLFVVAIVIIEIWRSIPSDRVLIQKRKR